MQPLIHQGLDFHTALGRLFFYLIQQLELDGNGAHHFELGVRRVGIKLGEVVGIPELPIFSSESALEMLLNLFSAIGFAFFFAHVASADDNGGPCVPFLNEKGRKISSERENGKVI